MWRSVQSKQGDTTYGGEIDSICKALDGKKELLIIDLGGVVYREPTIYDDKLRVYITVEYDDLKPPAPCYVVLLDNVDNYVLFVKLLLLKTPEKFKKSAIFPNYSLKGTLSAFIQHMKINAKLYDSYENYDNNVDFKISKPHAVIKYCAGCTSMKKDNDLEKYASGYIPSGFFYMYVTDLEAGTGYTKLKLGKAKDYIDYNFVKKIYLPINDKKVVDALREANEFVNKHGFDFTPGIPMITESNA